jgi:hypothetical protein
VIALILRMHVAKGCIEEVYLEGRHAARMTCPPALVPAPGQYLLATACSDTTAALAQPVYSTGTWRGGFYAGPPLPAHWLPGVLLNLRGPLGHGFSLPVSARRVALAAFNGNCARVLALLEPALSQKAGVVLLTDQPSSGLPSALEILPLAALAETSPWADYLAIELQRDYLPELLDLLVPERKSGYAHTKPIAPRSGSAQLLVETPVPCGGLAECGVCAVSLRPGKGYMLACKDGPVFDLY